MNKNTSCFIVAGPTASGKSDFAHMLAKHIGGAIINCDSVQIYRGIENISASPFAGREITHSIDGVPYYLFSVLDLNSHISVGDYLSMARDAYNTVRRSGYTPIFVGGTGYYINAILHGISPMPDISVENRERAREMVARDISDARKLLPDDFTATDPQRIARAIEVFLQTGHHLTEFQSAPRCGAIVSAATKILINPDMRTLRSRIASRIPQMISGGALAEAQAIIVSEQNPNRAIGAAQLCAYLRGEINIDDCIQNWITKTNQYAKRQRTWFRTQFAADITIDHTPTDADIVAIINK